MDKIRELDKHTMIEIMRSNSTQHQNRRQSGLSIVELMIAMLIGLFLLLAMIEILSFGKQSFRAAANLSRLQETGRIATQLIASDLKRAGYMGGNTETAKIFGSSGPTTPAVITCNTTDNSWGRIIAYPVVGLDDTSNGYNCIPNNSAITGGYVRGDVLTVRYASADIITGPLEPDRLYLRNDLLTGAIFSGKDAGEASNKVDNGLARVGELVVYNYFVGNSGRTCGNDPVPSLFRTRLNSNGRPSAPEEILPGVEQFQIQYSNGSRYADANEIVALADWDKIISAKIWLLVRTDCREQQFTDTNVYDMGDITYTPNTATYTPNTDFRRQLYSRVVKLNMRS